MPVQTVHGGHFPSFTRRRLGVVIDEYLVGGGFPAAICKDDANRNRAGCPQLLDLGAALLALVSPFPWRPCLAWWDGAVFGTWVAARMSSTSRSRASARVALLAAEAWASIHQHALVGHALAGEAHQARLHIRRQTGEAATSKRSSTAVRKPCDVLPPGPEARTKRSSSSASSRAMDRVIRNHAEP